MQTAVLKFERPLCHRTAHPESPESSSCLKHLLAQRKGEVLAHSCLPGLLGSKLIQVPIPQDERDRKAAPRWGKIQQDPCPHGRQPPSFTSCEIDSWGPGGVGLKQPQCGYLCRLFCLPSPQPFPFSPHSHIRVMYTERQLGLSRGLLKRPVKAEVWAPQPRPSWGNFVPSRR